MPSRYDHLHVSLSRASTMQAISVRAKCGSRELNGARFHKFTVYIFQPSIRQPSYRVSSISSHAKNNIAGRILPC